MSRFEYQFPSLKYLPSVTAKGSSTKLPPQMRRRVSPTHRSGADARHPHSADSGRTLADAASLPATRQDGPADEAQNELDYLTTDDRELIRAVTGEVIEPGRRPQDKPLSAFAMQLAVDRKSGGLSAGLEVSGAYLHRTNRLLLQLNVPSNPFSGDLLDRALRYVDRRPGGRSGRTAVKAEG